MTPAQRLKHHEDKSRWQKRKMEAKLKEKKQKIEHVITLNSFRQDGANSR